MTLRPRRPVPGNVKPMLGLIPSSFKPVLPAERTLLDFLTLSDASNSSLAFLVLPAFLAAASAFLKAITTSSALANLAATPAPPA